MSNAINSSFKPSPSLEELSCYLQSSPSTVSLSVSPACDTQHTCYEYFYKLPAGELRILKVTLYLPVATNMAETEAARLSTIESALSWQKRCLQQDEESTATIREVLIIDIQTINDSVLQADNDSEEKHFLADATSVAHVAHVAHSFGARYFIDNLKVDINEDAQMLQVFSWQDWQATIVATQTPSDLWRFLSFHLENLKDSFISGIARFESEQVLVSQFTSSNTLFSQAIAVDNELIKNGLQNEPNPALIAMSLAQKHKDINAQQAYQQHRLQAATLWSQLSKQMIDIATDVDDMTNKSIRWQQQLLDESLFSRHELIRTLYKHLEQSPTMREKGYVVHQHSYESLGRHYVMIFYGQGDSKQQSRKAIQPNLQKIAQDVATRLPLAELHHVIVLGVEFMQEVDDTYIDIDTWIQPVNAMTQKERQLTKQLQRLSQQHTKQVQKKQTGFTDESTRMQLSLNIPARKNNS